VNGCSRARPRGIALIRQVDCDVNDQNLVYGVNDPNGRFGDLKRGQVVYPATVSGDVVSGTVLSQTTYTYDLKTGDRLTEDRMRHAWDGNGAATGTEQHAITTYAYDAKHRVIRTTDPVGAQSETFYNVLGKIARTVDRFGAGTQ
jgi:YD repeat-containing protein